MNTHLTLARVFAYLAGILPVVQQLLPSVVPPPYGVIAAGVIGVGLTAGHQIYQMVNPPPPGPTITNVAKVFLAAALLPVLLGLSACTSLTNFLSTPSNALTITGSAVEVGVASALEAVPPAQRGSTASAVISASKALQAVDSNDQVSLSQFELLAAQRLAKANLTQLEQGAINSALQAAVQAITGKIQNGVLTPTQTVAINTVLNWIIVGATPYAPAS